MDIYFPNNSPFLSGFLWGLADKESACNEGDLGSIPGLPTPGEFHGLYNPCGRKELDQLSEFHFTSLPFLIRDAHTPERVLTLQPLNTLFPIDHFGCL